LRLLPLAALVVLSGCGGAASDLSPESAHAERAYAAGRYLEAAAAFGEAARSSPHARDREEARYRQAMALERGGRPEEARKILNELLHDFPRGARAPRAAYDHAILDIKSGWPEAGYPELDRLLRAYPDSGVAAPALRRYLDALEGSGEGAVRAYLTALAPAVARSDLAQYVDYEIARSLERDGERAAAQKAYLALADAYPYPRGVFWDDALYRAADLVATDGRAEEAIHILERLLGAREHSYLQGSYERGRYAEAQFRIAELYRDALGDPTRARAAFERFWAAYPTSRLRDDAAWDAAVLAAAAGDRAGACRNVEPLMTAVPRSRYAACAARICPSLRPPAGVGPCHEYLVRATREPP
jgi:tetratricopeptide (TPR) repeat protein